LARHPEIFGVRIDSQFKRDLLRSLILGFAVSVGTAVGTWLAKTTSKTILPTLESATGFDLTPPEDEQK